MVISSLSTGDSDSTIERIAPALIIAAFLVVAASEVSATVRRLHDLDRPGSDYFLLLIPIYGTVLGFQLLLKKGTDGPNRFDDDSQPTMEERVCDRCGQQIGPAEAYCGHCGWNQT